MAKQETNLEFNTFVGGLVTEASPLNFPPNASFQEDNFELLRDGSRKRRLGLNYEEGFKLRTSGQPSITKALQTFTWKAANDNPNDNFLVVQDGNQLFFHDVDASPISQTQFEVFQKELDGGSQLRQSALIEEANPIFLMDFTTITGKLIVTFFENDFVRSNIMIVSFNKDLNRIEVVQNGSFKIFTRDFWGVNDAIPVDRRPRDLEDDHHYNLLNQGWPISTIKRRQVGEDDNGAPIYAKELIGPIEDTSDVLGVYPSNADIFYLGKTTTGETPEEIGVYDPNELDKQVFGTTQAPRGRFIIEALRRSESRKDAANTASEEGGSVADPISELPSDRTDRGPQTVATFSSRVFWAGFGKTEGGDINSPDLQSFVFYSQIVKNDRDIFKCYQEADPTSEHISELLDTDGGFINIPEASNILELVNVGNSLFVFAKNGVWRIWGSDAGFSATNQQVTKVTDTGVTSRRSIVRVETSVMFWAESGIYLMSPNEVGDYAIQSLTESRIQTLYANIPSNAKLTARGAYDINERKVRWLFNDEVDYNPNERNYRFNRELQLDLALQAWSTFTFKGDSDYPTPADFIPTEQFTKVDFDIEVVVGAEEDEEGVLIGGDVVEVEDDVVILIGQGRESKPGKIKYYSTSWRKSTISEYNNFEFRDWDDHEYGDGIDADAFVWTGQIVAGDTARFKQAPYLTLHFTRTETGFEEDSTGDWIPTNQSSCFFQTRWDFADSAASNKFTKEYQGYRLGRLFLPDAVDAPFDYGQSVITTKNKLRGRGRAMSLYMRTEEGKDCQILGWAVQLQGNSRV